MQFPNTEQLFDVLQGEMPEGVYAQDRADSPDPAKRSYTSSEVRVWAELANTAYESLKQIYLNKFVTDADEEGIERWEAVLFTDPASALLSLEERRQRLLDHLRYIGGINFRAIDQVVAQALAATGLEYEIVTLSGSRGEAVWIFGRSRLGLSTYLAYGDPLKGTLKDHAIDCALDFAAGDVSEAELRAIQRTAYAYQVRIFGVADEDTLERLDTLLKIFEPARSTHEIRNNFARPATPKLIDGGPDWVLPADGFIDGGRFTIASRYDVIDGGTW